MTMADKAKLFYIVLGLECFQCCHVHGVIVPRLMDAFVFFLYVRVKGFGPILRLPYYVASKSC